MIPLATTTITVLRVPAASGYDEPYSGVDVTSRSSIYTHVPAVIDRPTGTEQIEGGQQSVWNFGLVCDPIELLATDDVRDERTGSVYTVVWALTYPDDHTEAGIRIVQGEI